MVFQIKEFVETLKKFQRQEDCIDQYPECEGCPLAEADSDSGDNLCKMLADIGTELCRNEGEE